MLINSFSNLLGSREIKIPVGRESENRAVVFAMAMETSWLVLDKHILS